MYILSMRLNEMNATHYYILDENYVKSGITETEKEKNLWKRESRIMLYNK